MPNITIMPMAAKPLSKAQIEKLARNKALFEELLAEFRSVNVKMNELLSEVRQVATP